MDLALREWGHHQGHHDAHPRLLQHLVRGKKRVEHVQQAQDGRGEDQQLAGCDGGSVRKAQRRLQHMLSGHGKC